MKLHHVVLHANAGFFNSTDSKIFLQVLQALGHGEANPDFAKDSRLAAAASAADTSTCTVH